MMRYPCLACLKGVPLVDVGRLTSTDLRPRWCGIRFALWRMYMSTSVTQSKEETKSDAATARAEKRSKTVDESYSSGPHNRQAKHLEARNAHEDAALAALHAGRHEQAKYHEAKAKEHLDKHNAIGEHLALAKEQRKAGNDQKAEEHMCRARELSEAKPASSVP